MSDTEQFPEFMSKATLCDVLGVSLPTAETFFKEGLPVISEGSAGREYRIPPGPAIHWFIGREAAKERGLEARSPTERVALGYAMALSAMPEGGTPEELAKNRRYVLAQSYRALKQCGLQLSMDDWSFAVGRWLGVLAPKPAPRRRR